ncbi:SRPBCC family protein [Pseudomonas sp. MYb185]|uniref:SRPBCC family protein n=1 Tax=Pseudomonas sp. MYb185 TaxID=1848729 RepID=UPI000CFCADBE|nr:SRPBCC family protein [Pseudomonas sp. MYb185]PRB84121.1 MxaD family protein [Pseudomonas sp. MYb185]
MLRIETHQELNGSAATVWALLADFANIQRWWPTDDEIVVIERVELEGEGIGQIRHIYNRGFPGAVSERLDFQDSESLSYKLSIVGERPAGLLSYQATGWISSLPGDRCCLNYCSEFTTQPGRAQEAEIFLRAAYGLMFKGLDQACKRVREGGMGNE